jgi:hypothetical protein
MKRAEEACYHLQSILWARRDAPITLGRTMEKAMSPYLQEADDLLSRLIRNLEKSTLDALKWEQALLLIATPMRPDGTWNRDREACRQLAQDALDGKMSTYIQTSLRKKLDDDPTIRTDFVKWFDAWHDPNIGLVEVGTQRYAAWAAWCEQVRRQLAQDAN